MVTILVNSLWSQHISVGLGDFYISDLKKTEDKKELKLLPCIDYFITLKDEIEALLDLESKVSTMSQTFTCQLGLKIWKTNVGSQKIAGTILEISKMIVFIFSVLDKDSRERFFEKRYLLADVKRI